LEDGMPVEEKVAIELAHPLRKKDLAYLGLPEGTYNAGQTIHVTRRAAEDLIKSGIAAVDPEDKDAVKAALARTASSEPPPQEQTDRERELLRLLGEARAREAGDSTASASLDATPGEPVPGTPLAEPSIADGTAPVAAADPAGDDAKAAKAPRGR
jgi:hypothetical protein